MRRIAVLFLSLSSIGLGPASSAIVDFPSEVSDLSYHADALIRDAGQPPAPSDLATANPIKEGAFETVWVRVERDVNAECKTCPYESCTNRDWYGSSYMFRASCWTHGAKVNSTTLWLKSEQDCFVSEFDTLPYWRNYTEDLTYCGAIPEKTTKRSSSVQKSAECKICPNERCETIMTYRARSSVTLTCGAQTVPDECFSFCTRTSITPGTSDVFYDAPQEVPTAPEPPAPTEWFRTKDYCYVNASLIKKPEEGDTYLDLEKKTVLEPCGPVPYLEKGYHYPEFRPPVTNVPPPAPAVTVAPQPPPPPCVTCAPFIWTFQPKGANATATLSSTRQASWPFSPGWLSQSQSTGTAAPNPQPQPQSPPQSKPQLQPPCTTCAPFIWTFQPQVANATAVLSSTSPTAWPFSPGWISQPQTTATGAVPLQTSPAPAASSPIINTPTAVTPKPSTSQLTSIVQSSPKPSVPVSAPSQSPSPIVSSGSLPAALSPSSSSAQSAASAQPKSPIPAASSGSLPSSTAVVAPSSPTKPVASASSQIPSPVASSASLPSSNVVPASSSTIVPAPSSTAVAVPPSSSKPAAPASSQTPSPVASSASLPSSNVVPAPSSTAVAVPPSSSKPAASAQTQSPSPVASSAGLPSGTAVAAPPSSSKPATSASSQIPIPVASSASSPSGTAVAAPPSPTKPAMSASSQVPSPVASSASLPSSSSTLSAAPAQSKSPSPVVSSGSLPPSAAVPAPSSTAVAAPSSPAKPAASAPSQSPSPAQSSGGSPACIPVTSFVTVSPSAAASRALNRENVVTLKVVQSPAVCECGAVSCPPDPALNLACSQAVKLNCQSRCAPTTAFYTLTFNPAQAPSTTPPSLVGGHASGSVTSTVTAVKTAVVTPVPI